jgi:hypothetical protein
VSPFRSRLRLYADTTVPKPIDVQQNSYASCSQPGWNSVSKCVKLDTSIIKIASHDDIESLLLPFTSAKVDQ